METLAGPDEKSGIVNVTYPKLETGYYIADPVFADFVRQAVKATYKLVAYEIEPSQRKKENQKDFALSIIERENAQSDNLIKHVLQADPKSRVFAYVGYSHATENWKKIREHNIGWFAAQLKKKTGIDPLTIDQVGGSFNPKSPSVDPVWKLIQEGENISEPTVAMMGQKTIVSDQYNGKVDLSVFHPAHRLIEGRPNWLSLGGYRKPFTIQNKEFYQGQETLVQAFRVEEKENAIPVDQILLHSKDGSSNFLLPKGKYRIQTSTIAENKLSDKTIEIK